MTERQKTGLIAFVVALLAVVAIWGWVRKPASAYASGTYSAVPMNAYGEPAASTAAVNSTPMNGAVAPAAPCVSDIAYTDAPPYASRNYVRTVRAEEPPPAPVVTSNYVGDRPVYNDRVVRTHERSKKKSVAIVAGSAGVGAAVGALAGGGKGAGIGALAGGAGGFIYDRLTHKHH